MANKAVQTMDLSQASQTIKWLDEERRKDKATIATLQEQVRTQEEQISQLLARVQDLQIKVSGVQEVISQAADFEETVQNYKNEMVFLLDKREEARRKEQAEIERLRKIEYEAVIDHLGELDKAIQVLPRYDDKLDARLAEDQRLSEALQRLETTVRDLNTRIEDRVQTVTYLEEQRRADNRRIADLEHDSTELRKRIETVATKLPLLEDMIHKQNSRIDQAMEEVRKYEKPIEELRVSDFQREQKMKHYLDQGEQVAEQMDRIRQQTQGFVEQHQAVKRALEKAESFQARVEKRQNEVAEMQRLSEDRIKRQWEEWQAERAKEKEKQDVLIQERWNQQERSNAKLQKNIDAMQPVLNLHHAQLDTLWEARRADAVRTLKAAQDKHETLAAQSDEHLAALRDAQE